MILVLGAGLAGLSTAAHLGPLPHRIFEREAEAGGLARTVRQGGFLFDFTGHLLHVKTPEVMALVDRLLGDEQVLHRRSAWVRIGEHLVPYPFQVHTHALPPELRLECVLGFAESLHPGLAVPAGSFDQPPPSERLPLSFLNVKRPRGGYALSFDQWTERTFGRGFARHFFRPYNEKNFATDPATLTSDWVSWAIPKPSLEEVLRGAIGPVEREYGYHPRFRYPRAGGIGRLADALAARVGRIETTRSVVAIRGRERVAVLDDGETVRFDRLVASNPLPELVALVDDLPDAVRTAAATLRWCAVTAYNFGLDRPLDHDRHWIYFPDPMIPFHRVGFPSQLTPGMAPDGRGSVCAEVARPAAAPPPGAEEERRVLDHLVRAGVIGDPAHVTTSGRQDLPFAYVLFDEARRAALPVIFRALLARGIVPVGRFGSWDYLSMEGTILQGLETAAWLRGDAS